MPSKASFASTPVISVGRVLVGPVGGLFTLGAKGGMTSPSWVAGKLERSMRGSEPRWAYSATFY